MLLASKLLASPTCSVQLLDIFKKKKKKDGKNGEGAKRAVSQGLGKEKNLPPSHGLWVKAQNWDPVFYFHRLITQL